MPYENEDRYFCRSLFEIKVIIPQSFFYSTVYWVVEQIAFWLTQH